MEEPLCIVCPHVFDAVRPVRLLARHDDGGWQAVCGERDHRGDCGDFETVGLNHLLERQPELVPFLILKPGKLAERTDNEWQISDLDEQDD